VLRGEIHTVIYAYELGKNEFRRFCVRELMMQDRIKQKKNFGVYLSPITLDHIAHLIGFSDDPELIDTMVLL